MKIGIIGSGIAGLGTAWLLEQDHEVYLFEQQDRVGGHGQTVYVEQPNGIRAPIEIGFEFFNKPMYPFFCRLLEHLHVATRPYHFTYSFFDIDRLTPFVLPPIQGKAIFWDSLTPSKVIDLLQLMYVMHASKSIVRNHTTAITTKQFLDSLWLTESFKYDFFLPLFCAGWGTTPQDFEHFAAYNLLSWMIENHAMGFNDAPWYEVVDGVSAYVNALSAACTQTTFYLDAPVVSVARDGEGYKIANAVGKTVAVDHLVVATNAHQAASLLQQLSTTNQLCDALLGIEYVQATLAVHNDERFMPLDKRCWSVANVMHNNKQSCVTMYKAGRTKEPVFRSWLMPEFPVPEHIYATEQYDHAKPTPYYFATQQLIAQQQGIDNRWLAGIYTQGIDSHESALMSGVAIARRLAPDSRRLKLLDFPLKASLD